MKHTGFMEHLLEEEDDLVCLLCECSVNIVVALRQNVQKTEPDFAGTPVIVLDGSSAGADVYGLTITVRG